MGSGLFTPNYRQMVDDLSPKTPISYSETLAIATTANIKDGAGSTGIISLMAKKILNLEGSQVGSFWGRPENMQYEKQLQALVETNGSATFTVSDPSVDLEKIFESVTKARYVAKARDNQGKTLYGWIGGVAKSGNAYTFDIFSGPALGTQNWFQGDATTFSSQLATVQIYKYTSSLSFGSADTFTEEVPLNPIDGMTEFSLLNSLSDGQYAVDYDTGILYFRKKNADDTETVSYKTYAVYPFITSSEVDTVPGASSLVRTPKTSTVTIGAGATALNPTSLPVYSFTVQNPAGNAEVYIGDSTVTSVNGQTVYATGTYSDVNVDLNQIYVNGTAGQIVRIFSTY